MEMFILVILVIFYLLAVENAPKIVSFFKKKSQKQENTLKIVTKRTSNGSPRRPK
jgi:hypothetical protein